jgi:hypothetical protein
MDPTTPITLSGSTFASKKMEFNSKGLHLKSGLFYYDENEKTWCYASNKANAKPKCKLMARVKLFESGSRKVVGLLEVDDATKTVKLFQVKKGSSFEINNGLPYLEFTDESTDSIGIFVAKGISPKHGNLGSITAKHDRTVKGAETPARRSQTIDLASDKVSISGCGGAITPAQNTDPVWRNFAGLPKPRFEPMSATGTHSF